MEIFANTTRFALACNMSNKIIEPIQSRCAILRYVKLRDEEVLKRLLEICEAEDVSMHLYLCAFTLTKESLVGEIQRRGADSSHLHFRG